MNIRSHILGLYILCICSTLRAYYAEYDLVLKAERINGYQLENSRSAHEKAASAQNTADEAIDQLRRRSYIEDGEEIKLVACKTNYDGERVCRIEK